MMVAITGATGFLGRYIVRHLCETGHACRCWFRGGSDRGGFEGFQDRIEWVRGELTDAASMAELVRGADAVIHAALDRPGAGFRNAEGDLPTFVERNVVGTIRLIEASRMAGCDRFVFISTCAVHEVILDDRKLDEAHPLWPASHYGAHKAAIEKFVHSYGLGEGYNICALRPTGIYGLARPANESRWYGLVQAVARGEPVASAKGGKEVHVADVARAVGILLTVPGTAGQCYNCYDMYVAEQDVAEIAKALTKSRSEIPPLKRGPRHQIDTSRLRGLGMAFGGRALLERTIQEMLDAGAAAVDRR
ncbi:MAG: NAD(P)-dependent oxidoreductase [Planctomycetes bacterium]|nr:NAD(P)-dependent oxidoreductase [Planctomycetota bacterium]